MRSVAGDPQYAVERKGLFGRRWGGNWGESGEFFLRPFFLGLVVKPRDGSAEQVGGAGGVVEVAGVENGEDEGDLVPLVAGSVDAQEIFIGGGSFMISVGGHELVGDIELVLRGEELGGVKGAEFKIFLCGHVEVLVAQERGDFFSQGDDARIKGGLLVVAFRVEEAGWREWIIAAGNEVFVLFAAAIAIEEREEVIVIALREACAQEKEANGEAREVAGDVGGMGSLGVAPEKRFEEILEDGEEDEVERGNEVDIHVINKPEEYFDVGAWKKNEIEASDGRNRAAGAEGGGGGGQDLAAAGEDAAGKIESEVADVAKFFVEVISEDVQKEHVEEDMARIFVEELVGNELIELEVGRVKKVRRCPGGEGGDGVAREARVGGRGMGTKVNDHICGDDRVIHPGDAALGTIGADGNEHGEACSCVRGTHHYWHLRGGVKWWWGPWLCVGKLDGSNCNCG